MEIRTKDINWASSLQSGELGLFEGESGGERVADRSNSSLWRTGDRGGPEVCSEVGRGQRRELPVSEGWEGFLGERSLS